MTETTEPDDAEIERIHEEAEEAALHCWFITQARNPYPPTDPRAEIWSFAFRQAYANENGY